MGKMMIMSLTIVNDNDKKKETMRSLLTMFFGVLMIIIMFTPVSLVVASSSPDPYAAWTHMVTLDEGVEVKWIASDPYYLTMEMSAPTSGYVGIGFSPTGGMAGSDIVIGWLDDKGRPHIKDYHAVEKEGAPIEDVQQDYELIAAEERDNTTIVRFRRRWETCDDKHDMTIGNDTMRLIWAWHADDPEVTSSILFKWHGTRNRGVKSVYMRSPPRPKNFPDDPQIDGGGGGDPHVKNWDLKMNNIHVNNKHTTYMCRIVRFPNLLQKHHMIGFRPIIDEGNREFVHHMSVYHCQIPEHLVKTMGQTESVFSKFFDREPGECYSPNMPPEWLKHCFTFLFTWAVGSEGEMFPDYVGIPLGESEESSYFKLEIHYDNPTRRTFLDSSGLRVFYTETIRKFEATTLFLGHRTTPFQMIPYGQEKFMTYSVCSSDCTQNGINPDGLRAISVMLHAHLSGRKIRLRHIRQGKELAPIAEDYHYDFNYQQFRILTNEVVILPGDELLVECEYNTLERDRFVFGGPDAEQEMCQAILFYYPRSNLTDCRSQPEFFSFFKTLGIENVTGEAVDQMRLPYEANSAISGEEEKMLVPPDNSYQLLGSEHGGLDNPFDSIKITRPSQMVNHSVGEHMRQIRWDERSVSRRIERGFRNGLHYSFCGAHAQRRIFTKDHIVHYPRFKEYRDGVKSACRGRTNKEKIRSQLHTAYDTQDETEEDMTAADAREGGHGSQLRASHLTIFIVVFFLFVTMTDSLHQQN